MKNKTSLFKKTILNGLGITLVICTLFLPGCQKDPCLPGGGNGGGGNSGGGSPIDTFWCGTPAPIDTTSNGGGMPVDTNNSCFDRQLYEQYKTAFCTTDCPGVIGCDGKFYCNECDANRNGIRVK